MKKFYAVQVGNDYSSDNGSTVKREAMKMARAAAKENPGMQIRISVCKVDDDYCMQEIVIRDGEC